MSSTALTLIPNSCALACEPTYYFADAGATHSTTSLWQAFVRQLVVEVHLRGCHEQFQLYQRAQLGELVESLERAGLRLFESVPNLNGRGAFPGCAELSFIHVSRVRDGWAGAKPCAEPAGRLPDSPLRPHLARPRITPQLRMPPAGLAGLPTGWHGLR